MSPRPAARWYARLLRLAPRRLRERHQAEMTQFFLAELDAARSQGRLATVPVWLRGVADLISGAVSARARAASAVCTIERGRRSRLEHVWNDMRVAVRGYRRAPVFTTAIIATLTMALGATSAIFAVVDAVVLRPLPYPASERLIEIAQHRDDIANPLSVSPPNYFDLSAAATSLAALAAYGSGTATLVTPGGRPERVNITVVTADFGEVAGVAPLIGRLFVSSDDQPGAPRLAVLNHRVWQQRFGADRSVIGRAIALDDGPATIVGVMPAGFSFPEDATDIWMPMRLSRTTPANPAIPPEKYRNYRVLSVAARLRPGVTMDQAAAEMKSIGASLSERYPAANPRMTFTIQSLKDASVGSVRRAMLLFLGGVVCLLLVACANVATLLAVRAAARQHDVSLRLALGSSRARIVQLLVIESLLLAAAGGAAGLGLGHGLLRALLALAPSGIPRIAGAAIDGRVVVMTFAISAGCGLLFSLAPVWQSFSRNLTARLRSGARAGDAPAHQRLRRALIIAEVALSMALLTTAGLLAQTTRALGHVERGFDDAGVFRVDRIELPLRTPGAASASFYERLQTTLADTPGIASAGVTLAVPLDPRGRFYVDDTKFTVDGRATNDRDRPEARIQVVSAGFFQGLRIPIVSGRNFDEHDGPTAPPVVIINAALAARYFPNGDAVGHWLTHDLSIVPGQASHRQIVGVAANVRQFNLDDPFEPQLFVPHGQMPWPAMALVIRSEMPADRVTAAVQSAVWAIDPRLPVPPAVPLADALGEALGQPRLRAVLLAAFAATALALAVIGLYGVIRFDVEQRSRELAIRLMLGATARGTRSLVVRDGLLLAATGAGAGFGLSYWAGRSLASLLFGVGTSDPLTIVATTALLLTVTAAASVLATRRIARIDPIRMMTAD